MRACLFALICFVACSGHAQAAIIIFSGSDPGVGPGGARPNSNAAAASFDAAAGALGTVNTINFESAPLGNFAALGLGSGVTATLAGTAIDSNAGITDVLGDSTLGYNTTAGGSRFLRVVPIFDIGTASATFDFDTPVQAFGTYVTGLGTAAGALHVVFSDGTAQDLSVAGSPSGGVQFFGFTDEGKLISSIQLRLTGVTGSRDIFSVDDVRFVAASEAVPEPSTLAIFAVAGLGAGVYLRRRKASGAAAW